MRRSRVAVRLAALSLTMTACSLSTSLEGLSSGGSEVAPEAGRAPGEAGSATDATVDAGASPEASLVADAGDAGGPPNIHPSGTFEGSNTCEPWDAYQGVHAWSATAHTGAGACRVCTAPGTTNFFTLDDGGVAGPALVGATYHAEAWVRSAPGQPVPSESQLSLRNFTLKGGFTDLETSQSQISPLDSQWRHLEATLTITKPGGSLNVYIGAPHSAGACFLIDDVVVRRVK